MSEATPAGASLAATQAAAINLHRAGRLDEAAELYRAVLARDPGYADALNLLSLVERDRGDLPVAADLSRAAVARFEHPVFLDNLGVILVEMGDLSGAEAAYRRGLEIDPHDIALLRDAVSLLVMSTRFEEAAALVGRLLAVSPDDPHGVNSLGLLAHMQDRLREAEFYYERAISLDPSSSKARINLLVLRLEIRQPQAAEELVSQIAVTDPEYRRARFCLSEALLLQGRWSEAWPHFEYRQGVPVPAAARAVPSWEGEPIVGKRFLIIGEAGLGDHIQFARYAALLKARGAARVIVTAPVALHRLLLRADGIDEVTDDPNDPRGADVRAPLMSLPLHFGTTLDTLRETLPRGLPYIHLEAEQAPSRAGAAPLRVGVFWAGFSAWPALARLDFQRSMSLHQLLPLMLAPDLRDKIAWTVLQRDRRPAYLEGLVGAAGWTDPFGSRTVEAPRDLADTAQIMADLDLVIGVDSALIHLSAALGRPTWMLDRWNHCWRWRPGATDSDWYPEVLRIFRQQTAGDWAGVVAAVHDALAALT
jgi:tetratricopeptide (TPR) repeat protein